MAKINLLPWREERRQQLTKEFYVLLGLAAGVALLLFGLAYYYFDQSGLAMRLTICTKTHNSCLNFHELFHFGLK